MKILLVNDYGSPVGGAEISLLTLRDGLRSQGHDARFFASSANHGSDPTVADYLCRGTMSRYRTLLQTANFSAVRQLRRVLKEFQPAVVHVRMFLTQLSPLILPLLRDVPAVYHVAWYRPICPLGTKHLPDGSFCRFQWGDECYRNGCLPMRDWIPLMLQMNLWERWREVFDLVVAESNVVKQQLEAGGSGPVEVIPPGIAPMPSRQPLCAPPTAVFAGRLVPEKGADVLLRAFSKVLQQIPAARLVIIGDGPEREHLTRLVAELKLGRHVSQLGHQSREGVERGCATAWVQLVPSLWAEPFGLVVAEAMMRGTAVIASDAGGPREIVVEGETGFLVPPHDVGGLADRMIRILGDRELAERMGNAGRQRAEAQYAQSMYVDRFLRVYHRLVTQEK